MVCKLSFKILLAESYLLCVSQPNELKRKIKKKTGVGKQGAKQKSGGGMAQPGSPLESPLVKNHCSRVWVLKLRGAPPWIANGSQEGQDTGVW